MELEAKAPRITFVNLSNGEEMEMATVPETLNESINPRWNDLEVLGMSHQPSQYALTENYKIEGFRIPHISTSPKDSEKHHDARRFLMSLCYPSEFADSVDRSAPPRTLLIWPAMLSVEFTIRSLKFEHRRFNINGLSVDFVATMDLHEIRDVRLTAEEVRNQGTFRAIGQGGGF
jgi:hypothetical protein